MKIKITTVYENVDAAWVQWWIKNRGPNYGIHKDVDGPWKHTLTNNDPSDPKVIGTTTIEKLEGKQ